MSISHAERFTATCPQCGQEFTVELWLIVDASEHPDLVESARDGIPHRISCPHCGYTIDEVDAPLLIFIPPEMGENLPPLLFFPAQQTTEKQDRLDAAIFLSHLRDALGDKWQYEWVEQIQVMSRPEKNADAAMFRSLGAEMRRTAEETGRATERPREDSVLHLETEKTRWKAEEAARDFYHILPAVNAMVEADSIIPLMRVARDYPALWEPGAEARVRMVVRAARRVGDFETVRAVELRYSILRGMLRAIEESGLTLDEFVEKLTQVEEMIQDMPEVAEPIALEQPLRQFIDASTWNESRRILEQHPELLSEDADHILVLLMYESLVHGDPVDLIEMHRNLLLRCREVGVEQAFAEITGASGSSPS